MSNACQLSELSRQELYDLIWSSPATQVGADFGISDVAVRKRCIQLNIPRPHLGYWAKLAAGRKPRKKPLPPTDDEVFTQLAQKRVEKILHLPEQGFPLHPIAVELMQAINKTKLDSRKRVHVCESTLPQVVVSKNLAERVAKAFHVILNGIETVGIKFCKFHGSNECGYFRRGDDRLYFEIEETMVDRLGAEKWVRWWKWEEGSRPSGKLAFTGNSGRYVRGIQKEWIETAKVPLERLLSQIVTGIRQHFLDLHHCHIQKEIERKKEREEWVRRTREWQAIEAIRLQKEKEQLHANALKSAAQARVNDLFKAAEWLRLSRSVKDFADECERRWKISSGELLQEQTAWLTWANELALSLSPFSVGYPDAAKHGPFEPSAIPFGGPYPSAQNFSKPPTLPIVHPPGTPLV